MLAVSWVSLLNAVELTVTPPGLVVPVTNHFAAAPFLKPLPDTITSRLMVPCADELGFAAVTLICAPAWGESRQLRRNRINEQIVEEAGCLTFNSPRPGFASVATTRR